MRSANYIGPKMRLAAPDQCQEMDELRAQRKPLRERLTHLGESSGTEEAAELQRRIAEIDAQVADLYYAAKQRLCTNAAGNLETAFTTLNAAIHDADQIQASLM